MVMVYELGLVLRADELGLGVMGQFQDLGFMSGVYGLWFSCMSQGSGVMRQGQGLLVKVYDLGYGLGLGLWAGFMSQGQGYELGLGLWLSYHNDYFYVAHQTRINCQGLRLGVEGQNQWFRFTGYGLVV